MKIYEIRGFDNGGLTIYWEPTLAAARARKRAMQADATENDPWDSITIGTIEVRPTRAEVARLLNDIIAMTCFNEH